MELLSAPNKKQDSDHLILNEEEQRIRQPRKQLGGKHPLSLLKQISLLKIVIYGLLTTTKN